MANLIDPVRALKPPVAAVAAAQPAEAPPMAPERVAFVSRKCICHKTKRSGHAFCMDCYLGLPRAMQRALWQPMGKGFEEAYRTAKAWLSV